MTNNPPHDDPPREPLVIEDECARLPANTGPSPAMELAKSRGVPPPLSLHKPADLLGWQDISMLTPLTQPDDQ